MVFWGADVVSLVVDWFHLQYNPAGCFSAHGQHPQMDASRHSSHSQLLKANGQRDLIGKEG